MYSFQRIECDPSNCTCVPATNKCYHNEYQIPLDANKMNISHGSHEMDFYFVLTVTNNAKLQTTKTFKVFNYLSYILDVKNVFYLTCLPHQSESDACEYNVFSDV